MDSKVVAAFVGGLVLATGITYIAVRPEKPTQVETTLAPAATPAPEVTDPVPAEAAEPGALPDTTAAPAESRWRPAERPAPVVRNQRAEPARTARPAPVTSPPAVQQQPAPAPAPTQTASNTPPPASATPPPTEAEAPPEPRPYVPPRIDVPPPPNKVTIPSGTVLTVRLSETLSTEKNQPGDQFTAVLDQPLVVDGFVLAERGARAQGKIVELERSGKVRGLAHMSVELTQIRTSDGQTIRLNTGAFKREANPSRKKDAAKIGAGAAIGAAIGAIAGGGKGAAIGAGVGGAAGAGQVAMSRGEAAELQVETRVSFRLAEPVIVTERTK
jgi:hypothetical protein